MVSVRSQCTVSSFTRKHSILMRFTTANISCNKSFVSINYFKKISRIQQLRVFLLNGIEQKPLSVFIYFGLLNNMYRTQHTFVTRIRFVHPVHSGCCQQASFSTKINSSLLKATYDTFKKTLRTVYKPIQSLVERVFTVNLMLSLQLLSFWYCIFV